jgi:hypothetical protein
MATGQLGELSQPGKPLYGIEHSNDGLITSQAACPSWMRTACSSAQSARVEADGSVPSIAKTITDGVPNPKDYRSLEDGVIGRRLVDS